MKIRVDRIKAFHNKMKKAVLAATSALTIAFGEYTPHFVQTRSDCVSADVDEASPILFHDTSQKLIT